MGAREGEGAGTALPQTRAASGTVCHIYVTEN